MTTLGIHDDDRSGIEPVIDVLDPADLVRRFYRSFELRDLSRLGSLLADDVDWALGPGVVPPALPVNPPNLADRQAVVSFLAALVDRSGGTCRWRLQQLLRHQTGAVLAVHEITASAAPMHTGYLLFTVNADLIQRVVVLTPVPSGPSGW